MHTNAKSRGYDATGDYKVKDYKERPHEYKEEYVTVAYRTDRKGVESLITLNYPHNY